MKYLVSHQGLEQGPFEIDEIVAKVRLKEIDLFDYVLDVSAGDWVLLMEFPPLAAKLRSSKPPRPPKVGPDGNVDRPTTNVKSEDAPSSVQPPALQTKASPSPHTITEWFVLKGENRFGPFSYSDLVKMQQQKVVFPFDFIWHAGLDHWKRLIELEDFRPETIRQLFSGSSKKQDLFVERKFARREFKGPMIVHDNLSVWKGQGFEISRGGVGVNMPNSLVIPGQRVFVHFKMFEDFPSINAVCEVVSKKFVNDTSPVQYGLRFLSLSQEVQDEFLKRVA